MTERRHQKAAPEHSRAERRLSTRTRAVDQYEFMPARLRARGFQLVPFGKFQVSQGARQGGEGERTLSLSLSRGDVDPNTITEGEKHKQTNTGVHAFHVQTPASCERRAQ